MQICQECKQPVIYIAVKNDRVVKCDAEPLEVYTQLGRKFSAYTKHRCEGKNENRNA